MTEPKTWATVAEAPIVGRCSRATVYQILIDPKCHFRTATGPDNVQRSYPLDFLHAQGQRKPARPKGTPSRNRRP